jgi:hypothetical protein
MYDPYYISPTGNSNAVDFTVYPKILQQTETAVQLDVGVTSPAATAFKIIAQKINPTTYANIGLPITTNFTNTPPLSVQGLTAGATYSFTITPISNGTEGKGYTISPYTMATTVFNGAAARNSINPIDLVAGQSYLTISNAKNSAKTLSMSYKDFSSITLPSFTYASGTTYLTAGAPKKYSETYYAFGTSVFLKSASQGYNPSAGIGFFVNNLGKTGYYILVETTKGSTAQDRKSIRICKADGTTLTTLADTQRNAKTTFEGVYGGQQYNLDVRVKISNQTVNIDAFVNGYKISAVDTTGVDPANSKNILTILDPTQTVALVCGSGDVAFDYAYATNLDMQKYNQSLLDPNLYIGKFSNDLLNMSFGNIMYDSSNAQDVLKSAAIEDFGTVVREIAHVKTKLDARPAFPVNWSTGGNKAINIIGQKISNFTAEAYVLNNSSTTVPLSDGSQAVFYLYGNTVGNSGDIQYSTDDTADYINKEPAQFASKWLQNLSDVKALAEWIKSKVINKGKIVVMNVFGNPLISVGDIISVKYTYLGLQGTEKMIVTSATIDYQQGGIGTSITARTL